MKNLKLISINGLTIKPIEEGDNYNILELMKTFHLMVRKTKKELPKNI